ncbi:MAG: glycosyltransferase family 39 protein [Thermodesulfobacteriota bacterium]|nr:glycosyltransferase family 39 protein [Thermodesulfobacteriota bacterium]
MIEDGGFLHPRTYAERYYVQYPHLTVAAWPPVFYSIEALLFGLLGISSVTAKLAVLLFSLLGINMFFLLCRLWFPLGLSVIASILCLLQPVMLFGQKNVMLEMPALAVSIAALYCLYIGTERNNSWALFFTPLFMALAFLTKQSAVFLLPMWLLWMILGKEWHTIWSRSFVSGVLVGAVALIPWIIISFTSSRFYVSSAVFKARHIWPNFLSYMKDSSEIVSTMVILLSIASITLFTKLRSRRGYTFALMWAGTVSLCLLLYDKRIVSPEPRQAIFLVPALIILCMEAMLFFKKNAESFLRGRRAFSIVLIILICLHLSPEKLWGGPDIQGFDKAADFVVKDLDCVSVLYDGYFSANFVFHMRARDKDRRVFVFRSSKVVYSTKWLLHFDYNELITEESEFFELLDRYSIKYIVQEEKDFLGTPAIERLRQWVQKEGFTVVEEHSIDCRALSSFGSLVVYEYLDYEAKPIRRIDLDMPVLGRQLSVEVQKGM